MNLLADARSGNEQRIVRRVECENGASLPEHISSNHQKYVKFTKHRIHATFRLPEKTSSIAKMTNYLSGRAKHLLGCIRLSNGSQSWSGI